MINLKGTGVALVTPFKNNSDIDIEALRQLVRYVKEGGVNYLVVQGSTGEAATLNTEEKAEVLRVVLEENNGELPVVLGHADNDTRELIHSLKQRDLSGVDAILSASPHYNKPTQEGIYRHFKALAEATDLPVILYNVPSRTASNISADTCVKLAEDFKNIVAVKEASGDFGQVMQIVKNKPETFSVISGDDALALPLFSIGVEGLISVTANAFPSLYSRMILLALKGDFERAREQHYELLSFTESLFAENNPAGLKVALQEIGICESHLRLPLVPVSDANNVIIRSKVKALMQLS